MPDRCVLAFNFCHVGKTVVPWQMADGLLTMDDLSPREENREPFILIIRSCLTKIQGKGQKDAGRKKR